MYFFRQSLLHPHRLFFILFFYSTQPLCEDGDRTTVPAASASAPQLLTPADIKKSHETLQAITSPFGMFVSTSSLTWKIAY